jgi:hypothetical protein
MERTEADLLNCDKKEEIGDTGGGEGGLLLDGRCEEERRRVVPDGTGCEGKSRSLFEHGVMTELCRRGGRFFLPAPPEDISPKVRLDEDFFIDALREVLGTRCAEPAPMRVGPLFCGSRYWLPVVPDAFVICGIVDEPAMISGGFSQRVDLGDDDDDRPSILVLFLLWRFMICLPLQMLCGVWYWCSIGEL